MYIMPYIIDRKGYHHRLPYMQTHRNIILTKANISHLTPVTSVAFCTVASRIISSRYVAPYVPGVANRHLTIYLQGEAVYESLRLLTMMRNDTSKANIGLWEVL